MVSKVTLSISFKSLSKCGGAVAVNARIVADLKDVVIFPIKA